MLNLAEVLEATRGELRGARLERSDQTFARLVVDSRAVTPGSLFVADPTRRSRRSGFGFGPSVFASVPYAAPQAFVPGFLPTPGVDVSMLIPVGITPPANTVPPSEKRTIVYVISGCYAGNRPPRPTDLPSGCDISKLRINNW